MHKDQQAAGREHLVSVDGTLIGYHAIDVDKAKEQHSYWEGIDEIIRAYSLINPNEMASIVADNKLQQARATYDTGSNKSGTQRQTVGLPFGLMLALEEYDEELFTNGRKLHEFMRLFPGLRTCRTV